MRREEMAFDIGVTKKQMQDMVFGYSELGYMSLYKDYLILNIKSAQQTGLHIVGRFDSAENREEQVEFDIKIGDVPERKI